MALCYGYTRVSTDEQFSTRLSIDEQQRQIREFCAANRLDLGPRDERLREESASAYKLRFDERPVGHVLNAQLQAGDHLVIAKLDRAFRDMVDAFNTVEDWQKRGVSVHILDIPSGGVPIFDRLILGILAWCAEFESHRRSERMADAYRSARRRGQPIRQCAPLGFRWVGHRSQGTHQLQYFPEEREHMRLCYELYVEHELSLGEIASHLMRLRAKPFDKRAPDAVRRSRLKVAEDYHPRRINELIRTECEFRYYEAQGLAPEEAAAEWLLNWGQDTLPTPDELSVVRTDSDNTSQTKGGQTCPVSSHPA